MKRIYCVGVLLLAALFVCPQTNRGQSAKSGETINYDVCFSIVRSNTSYSEYITPVFPAAEKDYSKVGDAFRQYAKNRSIANGGAGQCKQYKKEQFATDYRANEINKIKNFMHGTVVEIDWVYR